MLTIHFPIRKQGELFTFKNGCKALVYESLNNLVIVTRLSLKFVVSEIRSAERKVVDITDDPEKLVKFLD